MPWADRATFQGLYASEGPRAATSWLYEQSKARGFLHNGGLTRGTQWPYESAWGPILITVNEAKPEKDPRSIACAATRSSEDCVFCWDGAHEGRHLRVPLELGGRQWSLHYSPYAYFNEHCIVATKEHIPMRIDKRAFEDLLDLCDMFPHYFFGSNADLPIVGGSILSHHHYQGGDFSFPLDDAPIALPIALHGFPHVTAGLVKWPLTVVRLESTDKSELVQVASHVLDVWKGFSYQEAEVIPFDASGTPHNTITPIAHKIGKTYRLDLVLRNNAVSDRYPWGIFHPHEEVHKVKKENIGLIEAMGLAILPPRVSDEFDIADPQSKEREEVGALFVRGLEQCGVPVNEGFIWDIQS